MEEGRRADSRQRRKRRRRKRRRFFRPSLSSSAALHCESCCFLIGLHGGRVCRCDAPSGRHCVCSPLLCGWRASQSASPWPRLVSAGVSCLFCAQRQRCLRTSERRERCGGNKRPCFIMLLKPSGVALCEPPAYIFRTNRL